jgi:hypothetical protein
MDYDLNGLNPRDFEHLVQALGIKAIAAGLTPFGDGPDGGREASYIGKMVYPSAADPWNGYLVVQAKFLKKPTGVPAKDGAWVLKQLKSDLAKFEDDERNLARPDYYLLATNATLTPVSEVGFKDRVTSVLEQFKEKGLKSFDIWDYDKICRLLDGYPEIYRHYAGFITAGDVLTKVMTVLEGQLPDFGDVMSLFLQKELRHEQFVKLEQAGHTIDQKTSLANVFVDLPASDHPISNINVLTEPGIVEQVLQTGGNILRPSLCVVEDADADLDTDTKKRSNLGRYVIVGGPGQGKSTVGQFLCQMYRAAILQDCPAHTIAPEVRSVLNQIERQCMQDGVELPSARRFPVRIILDQFATDLANGEVNSLLAFILKQIVVASQHSCSADDLRRWLKFYPWLIVLDGLDEVPATSNRNQVLEAATEFFSQAAVLDADVLVVATTRPQGYNDEFSPRFYTHRYLSPLSEERALHYAERLTQSRYAAEPLRKAKILRRLRAALEQETTARLMQTPLQVTIMATLVDQIGQPPQERWRLFQQYYEVIYRRETERDIPASRILQQRKADVNAIHNRVGLLLQTETELAGNSDAQLTSSRFRKLVRTRVAEEGYEGEELELRVEEMTQAALHRLVFLVGTESDRIGFEIRSLQEFTAAEALMEAGDSRVRARLETIAPNSHWRNVFLFAAGKCFSERQFLRDMVIGICDQLNDLENDKLSGATLAGSRLALDILQDGVAQEQPNFARALARHAFKLLNVRDDEANTDMVAVFASTLEKVFREQLSDAIADSVMLSESVWTVLSQLAAKGVIWAEELLDSNWPAPREVQLRILRNTIQERDEWLRQKIKEMLPPETPQEIPFLRLYPNSTQDEVATWVSLTREIRTPKQMFAQVADEKNHIVFSGFRFGFKSLTNPSLKEFSNFELPSPGWAICSSAIRFEQEPSASTLARELRVLSKFWDPSRKPSMFSLAWPLHACLSGCTTSADLIALAEKAEAGKLGQMSDWIEAEQRWTTSGLSEADIRYMANDNMWPYDERIASIGFAGWDFQSHLGVRRRTEAGSWTKLFELQQSLESGKMKVTLSRILYQSLLRVDKSQEGIVLTPEQFLSLCRNQERLFLSAGLFAALKLPEILDEDWINAFEWIGDHGKYAFGGTLMLKGISQLIAAFEKDRTRHGLLKAIGAFALLGSDCNSASNYLDLPLDSPELKRAALLVQTSKGGWSETQAKEMVWLGYSLPEDLSTSFHMVRTLENHSDSIPHAERTTLALALNDKVIKHEQQTYMRNALKKLIQSRPTGLNDPTVWDNLGLPPKP